MEKSGLKNVKLADIRPYAKNPRIDDESGEYSVESGDIVLRRRSS